MPNKPALHSLLLYGRSRVVAYQVLAAHKAGDMSGHLHVFVFHFDPQFDLNAELSIWHVFITSSFQLADFDKLRKSPVIFFGRELVMAICRRQGSRLL